MFLVILSNYLLTTFNYLCQLNFLFIDSGLHVLIISLSIEIYQLLFIIMLYIGWYLIWFDFLMIFSCLLWNCSGFEWHIVYFIIYYLTIHSSHFKIVATRFNPTNNIRIINNLFILFSLSSKFTIAWLPFSLGRLSNEFVEPVSVLYVGYAYLSSLYSMILS